MADATNIITVHFQPGQTAAIASGVLFEHDSGQILVIEGLELPDYFQVHFANSPTCGDSYASLGTQAGVPVPTDVLQSGAPVYAFVYLSETASAETIRLATIYVVPRPQLPSGTPTPEQATIIQQAIAALNENSGKAEGWAVGEQNGEPVASGSPFFENNAKYYAEKAAESATDAAAAAVQAAINLAPVFSDGASYSKGYYVLHEGQLYVFIADHPAGAWIGTDAKAVTLGGALSDLRSSLSGRINVLHQLVDYGYPDWDLPGDPSASLYFQKLGVSRRNTQVKLNLAEGVNGVLFVKLSGSLSRAASNASVDAWDTGLSLIEGHKYRAYMALISGSVSGDNAPTLSVYVTGTHTSIGTVIATEDVYIREFTAPATPVNLAVYIYKQTALTDAVYQVILEDVTAGVDGPSLREDITELSDEVTELTGEVADLTDAVSNMAKLAEQLHMHTVPQSIGELNVIRRARQMTDSTWSPVEDNKMRREFYIPCETYEETLMFGFRDVTQFFRAGETYTGFPYSEWNDLGTDIGFETCVTSMMTPKSVMMELSGDIRNMGSPYYGTSCSTLVCYALALPHISTSNMIREREGVLDPMPGLSFVQDIVANGVRQSLDGLQLADILWVDGHCAMVTDIIKSDGHVTDIEVSESSMTYLGSARRWMWTLEDFYTWFADFKVFRYSKLNEVNYTPNIYAPLVNEGNRNAYTAFNVVPYFGNKCFIVPNGSASIKLVVRNAENLNRGNPPGTLAFTHIVLKKDGVAFGSPIEIDATKGTNAYVTGDIALDTDEATYTACLAALDDGGNIVIQSKECEWCVFPIHTPTISYSNRLLTITVTLRNTSFSPLYFTYTRYDEISWRTAMHVTPDKLSAVENSDGSVTYTIEYTCSSDVTITYVAVGYSSPEYGTIRETYAFS